MDRIKQLSAKDWDDLEYLYKKIKDYTGPYSETITRRYPDGSFQFPFSKEAEIVTEFRNLFSEKVLMVDFDWVNWQEGKDILAIKTKNKFSGLDTETILKLVTGIIRSDRFNDGILARLFVTGDAAQLLKRLLEFRQT